MNTSTPNSLQLGMIGNCAYSGLIDREARAAGFDAEPDRARRVVRFTPKH